MEESIKTESVSPDQTETEDSLWSVSSNEQTYSNDFTNVTAEKSRHSHPYSEDFESESAVDSEYSDDFESETKFSTSAYHYSHRGLTYNTLESDPRRKAGIVIRKPKTEDTQLSVTYSDDFLTATQTQGYHYTSDFETDGGTSKLNTARSLPTIFSEDFSDDVPVARKKPHKIGSRTLHFADETESIVTDYGTHRGGDDTYTPLTTARSGISKEYSLDFVSDSSDVTKSSAPTTRSHRKSVDPYTYDSYSETETYTQYTKEEQVPDSPETQRKAAEASESFIKRLTQNVRSNKHHRKERITESTKKVQPESKRTKEFCTEKAQLIRDKLDGYQPDSMPQNKKSVRYYWKGMDDKDRVEDYGIPSATVNRLKMENTIHNVKKAATTKVHYPRKCKHCRSLIHDVALERFAKEKKAVVSEKLIKEKLENHMLQCTDGLYLWGQIIKDLPKLSDTQAMDKLTKPLWNKNITRKFQNTNVDDGTELSTSESWDIFSGDKQTKPVTNIALPLGPKVSPVDGEASYRSISEVEAEQFKRSTKVAIEGTDVEFELYDPRIFHPRDPDEFWEQFLEPLRNYKQRLKQQ